MNKNLRLPVIVLLLLVSVGAIFGVTEWARESSGESELTITDIPDSETPDPSPLQTSYQTPNEASYHTPNPSPSPTVVWSPNSTSVELYVVPPITDEQILPTSAMAQAYASDEIVISASPGEFEPASFVVQASKNLDSLQVNVTELIGAAGPIPSSSIDTRTVKCWYQSGETIHNEGVSLLTPELLLKNDDLVKVEDGHNYLNVSGEYIWISSPDGIDGIPVNAKSAEFPVQDSSILEPVNVPANTNKQFWITVKIPDDTAAGTYTGKVELSIPNGLIGQIELELEVLPIKLSDPLLTYSIFYHGRMNAAIPDGEITDAFKSETQYRAEMSNMFDHGVTNPTVNPLMANEELARAFTIRNEVGMSSQSAYFYNYQADGYFQLVVERVPRVLALAQTYGIVDAYFYGEDEAIGDWLLSQRPQWEDIHQMGAKVFASGYTADWWPPGHYVWVGDILDLLVCAGEPIAAEAADWHSQGHLIFCYANPQGGEERPEKYRRNYGLLLWQRDYDGAMTYAYQGDNGNPWNDFDPDGDGVHYYRDHLFTYPTVDGVIDTIQWEGFREGVDDVRYLTALLQKIEEVRGFKDTTPAEEWLADLKNKDLTTVNLDVVRSEMVEHILSLQSTSRVS